MANDHPITDLRGRSSPFHDLRGFVMTEWRAGHCVIVCDAEERLTATGTLLGQGRQLFFCRSEVRDAAGTLVAASSSTHRYRGERAG